VSRKVDPHAVGRNRIKRALRDAFRHLRARLPGGAYVVVARSGAAQADGAALREAFERLLQRAGALPPPSPAGTMPPATPAPSSDQAPR
jgi:ribonuclease P protein component